MHREGLHRVPPKCLAVVSAALVCWYFWQEIPGWEVSSRTLVASIVKCAIVQVLWRLGQDAWNKKVADK